MYDSRFNSGALLCYQSSDGLRFVVIINHKLHLNVSRRCVSFISDKIDPPHKVFCICKSASKQIMKDNPGNLGVFRGRHLTVLELFITPELTLDFELELGILRFTTPYLVTDSRFKMLADCSGDACDNRHSTR